MKYQDCVSGSPPDARNRASASTGTRHDPTRSPGLDMNLQAHLGRTLRRVYEPAVGSELPHDVAELLQELDSLPARSSSRGASRD